MRPADLISSLFLFASSCTAWPSGWQDVQDIAERELRPLLARATTSYDLSFSATQGNTATTKSAKSTNKSNGKQSGSASASASGSQTTGKGNGKSTDDNGKKTTSQYKTTKTFDDRLPAGGVSMITPAAIAGPQYYKVGDYVTFAWNYTSLSITPSAVDILASCSLNSATYTIAMNETVHPTQEVIWDTGKYQATATIPLLVETYTLIVYDADSAPTAMGRAGYLAAYNQFTFGMYTPQPYVPMEDFVCATCNGAISSMERHTLGFLLGTVAVTVLSFGWFAGVAGLW